MRLCLGCQQMKAKRELIRVVRTPAGTVEVDPTGKRSGRGAYVCPDPACLEAAFRNERLERALEVKLEPHLAGALREAASRPPVRPPKRHRISRQQLLARKPEP